MKKSILYYTKNGITLVSLVITIIVLLILAGVTLNIVLNQDGIMSKAQTAVIQTKIENEKEILSIAAMGKKGNDGKINFSLLDSNLPDGFWGNEGRYKSEKTGRLYEISENGKVTLIEEKTMESTDIYVKLENSIGYNLLDYKIYGNSVQKGNPEPNAPIEIESVGDKTKNLINTKTTTENLYINPSGNIVSTNSYGLVVTEKIYVKPSTYYTFSGMGDVQTTTVSRTGYQYDENDNPISAIGGSSGNDITFITSPNCSYVIMQYVKTEQFPQLEEGTKSTSYEKYGYKIPLKIRDKNLLDIKNRTLGTLSSTYINTEIREFEFDKFYVGITMNNYYIPSNVKTYSISGENITMEVGDLSGYGIGFPVKAIPKTEYTMSNLSNAIMGVGFYTAEGEILSWGTAKTFITPENCEIMVIILRPNPNQETTYSNIQLELGNVATQYETNKGIEECINIYLDEPLRKLGNEADYIDFKQSKVIRNCNKINLNDSMDFYFYTYDNDLDKTHHFYIVNSYKNLKGKTEMLSNRFKAGNYFMSRDENESMFTSKYTESAPGKIYGQMKKSIIDNLAGTDLEEKLKNYFKENNTYIVYVLEEKIEETVDLPEILTEEGTNIIEVDTEIKPSKLEIKYYTK